MNKMEEWEEAEHKQLEANPVFIQIVDINGKTIFQSANLQRNIFLFNPNARKILFFNSTVSNQKIRQGQFPVYNDKDKVIGQLTIGISRQESHNVLHNLFIVLCVVFITIVSVLYFIMYFVASRAIAPIQGLINSASQITYTNLDSRLPLPDNKDEIFRLAATINELLHRLEVSFSSKNSSFLMLPTKCRLLWLQLREPWKSF
jgi:HAMP domain-containing protein